MRGDPWWATAIAAVFCPLLKRGMDRAIEHYTRPRHRPFDQERE